MNFNEHWNLKDRHAFLSPSQFHWVNYSPERLEERYFREQMKKRGIELHDFASRAIQLGRRMPKNKDTLNMFVNDALGFGMKSEQPLYYSDNCFGTADAISFYKNKLRIHDLKTGEHPASMMQLKVYAALFCLEYAQEPRKISIELRIYQNDEIVSERPEPEEISDLMHKIVEFDALIEEYKAKKHDGTWWVIRSADADD